MPHGTQNSVRHSLCRSEPFAVWVTVWVRPGLRENGFWKPQKKTAADVGQNGNLCGSENSSKSYKKKRKSQDFRFFLELMAGFEPATYWLRISCSTSWATPAYGLVGAVGLILTNQLLYRLSYISIFTCKKETKSQNNVYFSIKGSNSQQKNKMELAGRRKDDYKKYFAGNPAKYTGRLDENAL